MTARRKTFGSLFSGIGGIDLGLERAGFECRWQVEINPFCRKILAKHWPEIKRYEDITQLTGRELEPVDLLCGGFPCQDLSYAGKQTGIEGSRSGLWFEYARLIGILRPRYVLIENVPGLLVHDAMRRVIGELARLGYVGIWRCFRASEFGASHLRKRVFIVAYRSSERRRQVAGSSPRDEEADRREGRHICEPDSDYLAGSESSMLAYSEERGRGELREPSGCNGLADRRSEAMAHSEHPRCERIEGLSTGRETDTEHRLRLRNGIEGCDPHVAHSAREGLQKRGSAGERQLRAQGGKRLDDRPELYGGHVDDSAGARCNRPEDTGADTETTGEARLRMPEPERGRQYLENSARDEQPGLPGESGGMRGRGVCISGEPLDDAAGTGPESFGAAGTDTTDASGQWLGAFAPGPNDPRWPAILRARPDLAPALANTLPHRSPGLGAETKEAPQSEIRILAARLPSDLDRAMSNRTKRLSALGNSVVPQIAEYIGRILQKTEL